METVEIIIKLSEEDYERLKEYEKAPFNSLTSRVYESIANGILLPENHGKIVNLGKIDEDKINKDNPIITININGTEMEVVSLDYLDNLPDLTKKEK